MKKTSDRIEAREYAEGAFLRSSAMWALAGITGAFGSVFLAFSRGTLEFAPMYRGLALGMASALLGLGHSRYQYYLLETFPGHYADLARLSKSGWTFWKGRPGTPVRPAIHPKRGRVLLTYVAGVVAIIGLIALLYRGVPPVSAFFYAVGGFFLARVAFWKRAVDLWKSEGSL